MRARWLQAFTVLNTLALAAITLSAFTGQPPQRFTVIDVERINVVDSTGARRIVISNRGRSPGVIEHGEEITPGGGRAGLIFYNDEETEAGGLIFGGRMANGNPAAVGSLTFDQFNRDQAVALQYVDQNGTRRAGLAILDYAGSTSTGELLRRRREIAAMPDGPAKSAAEDAQRDISRSRLRLYAGRSRDDGAALVSLHDGAGRTRLRMRVDTLGSAVIEFLSEDGSVARTIAP